MTSRRTATLLRTIANLPAPDCFYIVHAGPGSCGIGGLKLRSLACSGSQLAFVDFEMASTVYEYVCLSCGYLWTISRADVADLMRVAMYLSREDRLYLNTVELFGKTPF
jgi:hypothetical protein